MDIHSFTHIIEKHNDSLLPFDSLLEVIKENHVITITNITEYNLYCDGLGSYNFSYGLTIYIEGKTKDHSRVLIMYTGDWDGSYSNVISDTDWAIKVYDTTDEADYLIGREYDYCKSNGYKETSFTISDLKSEFYKILEIREKAFPK